MIVARDNRASGGAVTARFSSFNQRLQKFLAPGGRRTAESPHGFFNHSPGILALVPRPGGVLALAWRAMYGRVPGSPPSPRGGRPLQPSPAPARTFTATRSTSRSLMRARPVADKALGVFRQPGRGRNWSTRWPPPVGRVLRPALRKLQTGFVRLRTALSMFFAPPLVLVAFAAGGECSDERPFPG